MLVSLRGKFFIFICIMKIKEYQIPLCLLYFKIKKSVLQTAYSQSLTFECLLQLLRQMDIGLLFLTLSQCHVLLNSLHPGQGAHNINRTWSVATVLLASTMINEWYYPHLKFIISLMTVKVSSFECNMSKVKKTKRRRNHRWEPRPSIIWSSPFKIRLSGRWFILATQRATGILLRNAKRHESPDNLILILYMQGLLGKFKVPT